MGVTFISLMAPRRSMIPDGFVYVPEGRFLFGSADEDSRAVEPVDARALEQQTDHALRDVEVGDRTAAQRPHGHDVARCAADHLPGFLAHGEHILRAAVERDDRRLVEDDSLRARVYERVRRTKIDREVARQGVASYSAGRRRRDDFSGASARRPRSNSSMLCSIELGFRLRSRIAVIPAALASIANSRKGMCDQALL